MSNWKPSTVKDVVQGIENDEFVLPVIQRSLVWDEEKMELLFDSLLKGNSFGGIMVLRENYGSAPLFASRPFSRHGEELPSSLSTVIDRPRSLVIDGQQRLQTFYMGIRGSINGKFLFFNLLSLPEDYEFQFAHELAGLPSSEVNDAGVRTKKLWHRVDSLYRRLCEVYDTYMVAEEVVKLTDAEHAEEASQIRRNIHAFGSAVLTRDSVGMCSVFVNSDPAAVTSEKSRIVELFRRLNDGGTRLSAYDLVAAIFKGFDYRMESVFHDLRQFKDIQITQDEVIKLIFLLQDDYAREVTQVTEVDSDFVISNRERIVQTLVATRELLKKLGLYEYYQSGSRSVIPLYFLGYHIFHKRESPQQLRMCYANYDVNNPDFEAVKYWLYLSLLNGVFSRRAGWIPYKTGVRKTLNVLKRHKGGVFPVAAMLQMYMNHPLDFSSLIAVERLNHWDADFVLYLIYHGQDVSGRDVDHIHPRSTLRATRTSSGSEKYTAAQIDTLANYQLLDPETNRDIKRALSFADWLEKHVSSTEAYIGRHLIPENQEIWQISRYLEFLECRAQKIVDKVKSYIPELNIEASPVIPDADNFTGDIVDIASLRVEIQKSANCSPVIFDETTWKAVFANKGLGPWAGRYRHHLEGKGIKNIGDFAVLIAALRLEIQYNAQYANVYCFATANSSGEKLKLDTANFGGWGWHIVLQELEKRGFNWQQYLVS